MTSGNRNSVTVKEAANKLNISERTVWKYIQKNMLKASRNFSSGRKPKVMVFESSINDLLCRRSLINSANNLEGISEGSLIDQNRSDANIPLRHYEEQRSLWLQERDQLQAGLMMYRYKFEELEHQMKLLPAPPEMMTSKMSELEEALAAEVQYREQATSALQEEQRTREALEEELKRVRCPWWKRLLGMK